MMPAEPDISTRYVRIATRHHRAWARQIGAFRDGHLLVFALVDADGRDLGQVLLADDCRLELEPAVLQPDGLHRARR
jgi:hypothetical protein